MAKEITINTNPSHMQMQEVAGMFQNACSERGFTVQDVLALITLIQSHIIKSHFPTAAMRILMALKCTETLESALNIVKESESKQE